MPQHVKRIAATALAAGLLAAAPAAAQPLINRPPNQSSAFPTIQGRAFTTAQRLTPSFVPTQLQRDALRNWAFNTAVIGRTYASLPPWLFGYNPYPPINYGPVYQPVGGGYSPVYN